MCLKKCNRRILAAEFRQRFNIHILHDSHSVYYFLRTV
nr:MAG TPA: hypothetical protein [Bacteriophage sp.]